MKHSAFWIGAALALAAGPVLAEDHGFYLGAGAGQVRVEVKDVLGIYGANFDESDTGFKVFGGYRFTSWLSVEGAYLHGGSPSVSGPLYDDGTGRGSVGIDLQSLVAAAVFTLPLGEKFELFVKPGVAYWRSDTSVFFDDPLSGQYRFSQRDEDSALLIGGGLGFRFDDRLGVRLEYEWFEVTPEWDGDAGFIQDLDASAGFISASFVYRF